VTGQPIEAPGAAPRRAAAFFDLDRTLMEGSSGFYWARAAHRAGLISRRRLVADAWENLKFRLRGSTDAAADAVLKRVGQVLTNVPVRNLQRLAPSVLA
jgi:phosphoserine phosphatase